MNLEQKIIRLFHTDSLPPAVIGIGDDAAFLPKKAFKNNFLISTDVMVEGTHYSNDYFSPAEIAFKLVEKAVSDIYVKGGIPCYALLNLALKPQTAHNFTYLKEFAAEIAASTKRHKMSLIGGDTVRTAGADMFTLTVWGEVEKFIPRKNPTITAGDLLVVQGLVGASHYAMTRLQKKEPLPSSLRNYHVRPKAYAAQAEWLVKIAKVAIDQSDSLYEALQCIAEENKLILEVDFSLIPTLPEIARYPDFLLADYVLGGGEDFAVLAIIAPPNRSLLPPSASVVGQVKKTNARPAVQLLYENKEFNKSDINYYLHFLAETAEEIKL